MTTIAITTPATPAPAEISRLGAREAARQAALLQIPTGAGGRLIADPLPARSGEAR